MRNRKIMEEFIMSKIYQGTLELIGKTPLVELTHVEKKYNLEAISRPLLTKHLLHLLHLLFHLLLELPSSVQSYSDTEDKQAQAILYSHT